MLPACGRSSPRIALSKVVLPEPFGPITPRKSPRSTAKSSRSRMRLLPYPSVTPLIRSNSFGMAGQRLRELAHDVVDHRDVVGLLRVAADRDVQVEVGDPGLLRDQLRDRHVVVRLSDDEFHMLALGNLDHLLDSRGRRSEPGLALDRGRDRELERACEVAP